MASSGSFNTGNYDGRYLNFSWSVASQSIGGNSTTINWTLKGAGGDSSMWYMAGNFKVVIDGSTVYSSANRIQLYNGTTVASGSFTMTHSSDGNRSFSAYAEAGIYYYAVNCSGSGSWSLPTIPRAATLNSATNFNDTGNPTITYSNPAGNSVSSLQACISLTGANDDIAYRDISKTGTSYTFELTTAERQTLLQATPNSNTLAVRFYVKTVISGTTYTNYKTAFMTVVGGEPTFSAAYLDSNSTTVAITGNDQQIIQNQSTLQVNISNATATKYATLASATCVINGTTYSGTLSSSSYTFNIGALNVSNNTTAVVTVTDSRGNATTISLPVTIIAWSLPTAIITAQRANNYYDNTTVEVDADFSSVDSHNSITIQVRYKKTSDQTWSSYITFQSGVSQVISLDNDYAWDLQTLITDIFGSTTYNTVVGKGVPIAYFDRLNNSVGFGCFPQHENSVEINGWDLLFHNGDTYTFDNSWAILPGIVTGSKQSLAFTLPLPKIAYGLNVSITTLKINVRHSDGGFTLANAAVNGGYNVLTDNTLSVSTALISPTLLGIRIAKSSGTFYGTNNSPQAIQVGEITLSFATPNGV